MTLSPKGKASKRLIYIKIAANLIVHFAIAHKSEMNREEYIKYINTFPDVSVENPFDLTPVSEAQILVARHTDNRKWFAVIFVRNGELFVDLKCDPPYAEYLREHERGVREGYHMNKRHWISVYLEEASGAIVEELTNLSYWLTAAKKRGRTEQITSK